MKKLLSILVVLVLSFSIFASISSIYEKSVNAIKTFVSEVEFTPISLHPIYEDYKADVWNSDTQVNVLRLNGAGLNSLLVQTRYEAGREKYYNSSNSFNGEYVEEYVYEMATFSDNGMKTLLKVKPSLYLGLLRLNYKDVTTELYAQFGLNAVLGASGGNDMFGYDGMYGFGASASYKDFVKLKVGLHHFSGHYGDEVLDDMWQKKDEKGRLYSDRANSLRSFDPGYIAKVAEYVRQDGLILGISAQPNKFIRVYAEADIVRKNMNTLRPWVVVPNGVNCTIDNEDMSGRIGSNEGILNSKKESRKYAYSDKYRAFILNAGAEFSYDFKKAGELSLSYNVRLNQEGQTKYQFNCYREENDWDVDHSVRLSYQFKDSPLSVDLSYYKGRIPLLNYFYYHDSYFGVGLSINL